MATVYYDTDADLGVIQGRKIAVLGLAFLFYDRR